MLDRLGCGYSGDSFMSFCFYQPQNMSIRYFWQEIVHLGGSHSSFFDVSYKKNLFLDRHLNPPPCGPSSSQSASTSPSCSRMYGFFQQVCMRMLRSRVCCRVLSPFWLRYPLAVAWVRLCLTSVIQFTTQMLGFDQSESTIGKCSKEMIYKQKAPFGVSPLYPRFGDGSVCSSFVPESFQ